MEQIEREILRYLGYKKASLPEEEVLCAIAECREQTARLQPRHIWTELPIQCNLEKQAVKIGEEWVHSSDFTRYISGCIGTVVLAATLGWEGDRMLRECSVRDMAKGVIMQATLAAYLEESLDGLQEQIKKAYAEKGLYLRSR